MEPTVKMGKVRKGWEMTKSSWRVLMLDKELASLPLIGMLVSLILLIPFGAIYLLSMKVTHGPGSYTFSGHSQLGFWTIPLFIAFYFVMTLVSNFFSGAVIHGATLRFRGGDPTVRGSISAAKRKLGPLALFSLLMATVGLALQTIQERVPFAGQIAVWLLGAAWNIANFFALPIIVLSDHSVAPLDATKQSVQMVRKVWGESVVAEAGVSLIGFFAVIAYMFGGIALSAGIGASLSALRLSPLIDIPLWGLIAVGLFTLILVFSVLGGIVKAALYHYATTGESPVTFNQNLLRAAMTPKKARRIFG